MLYLDKFDDTTGNYTQTVLLNGNTVSSLSTRDGHAQGWGSAVECAETNCGTVASHCKIMLLIIPIVNTCLTVFSVIRLI